MTDPTRDAAYALLHAVFSKGRSLDSALDSLPRIEARDKAAAHRLAAAVLRHAGTLDAVLEPYLRREPPPEIRTILRMGAAGLLFLGTPPHAAVGTVVALTRSKKLVPFAGLVNAVLRRVVGAAPHALDELDKPRLNTPAWAWTSWGKEARAIATAHAQEAPLDISALPGFTPEGGTALPTGSWRFPAGTPVAELPGFTEGKVWVQDAAAALPAKLLAPQPGERVLDLCAAPGGKTAQLCAMGGDVTAVERDKARMATLRGNLDRLHLKAELVTADGTQWHPAAPFSAILLDAPCSATGTVRRHPELLHLRKPRDIEAMTVAQDALLDAATQMLTPGGRLIYAVCSLQPQEGPARIDAACARLNLKRDPLTLPTLPEAVTGQGDIRTHPGLWAEQGGMDGFFIARLVRA
ncbi:transcription antitermination factor NusB [Acidocella aminolytica]|uniref:RNA methyltransferase n=1 Tax=Acidocella aminolytica 101 = DSM 11237 TaxID=1120923 RepID=A0A0D6PJ91_9PROT|nr:transcription antitermination factor NusB [Acidocella aminolytica]GAN81815.1 RNA methyltransferase [Acidocella aminolytica 101 = DSM 11237]GBQ36159.1 tRNA/rRNA cytosine-C5-methylase Nol1/Nop2/Sun [Acidocella aminolytica 101 = DSM 11237]SHE80404.1 16S rRNA (cytosine967-C5)-methyltransferase [Acidocella aminolytica 101 = DSM 11237]